AAPARDRPQNVAPAGSPAGATESATDVSASAVTAAGADLHALLRTVLDRRTPRGGRCLDRLLDRVEEALDGRAEGAEPVHLLRDHPADVLQLAVSLVVAPGQRLVHLLEAAVQQTPDDAGLHAVGQHLAVVLL